MYCMSSCSHALRIFADSQSYLAQTNEGIAFTKAFDDGNLSLVLGDRAARPQEVGLRD